MLDLEVLLDDVESSKAMLEKEELSRPDLVLVLRNLLRMKSGVKFFCSEGDVGHL